MCVNGLGLTSMCENVNVELNIFMWFYVAMWNSVSVYNVIWLCKIVYM